MSKEYYISSDTVSKDCKKIAEKLKKTNIKFKRIVAVTRGGMLPACLIAQYLNIREIHTLALYSYNPDGTQGAITTLVMPNVPDEAETLFIDDLIDSGNTAVFLNKNYPNSSLCVAYAKERDVKTVVPATPVPEDAWVVFPWEANPLDECK